MCKLFTREIVIMVQTYVQKKHHIEIDLLSTHNTCIRHTLLSGGQSKYMDLFTGHYRVSLSLSLLSGRLNTFY